MSCYQCGSAEGSEVRLCPKCTKERIEERKRAKATYFYQDQEPEGQNTPDENTGQTDGQQEVNEETELPPPPKVLLLAAAGLTFLFLLVAVYFLLLSHRGGPGPVPSAEVIAPIVGKDLLARKNCSGTVNLNYLTVQSVGPYNPDIGGFPVFGDFSVGCKEGDTSTTWLSSDPINTPASYVRKGTFGSYEAFVPPILAQYLKDGQKIP